MADCFSLPNAVELVEMLRTKCEDCEDCLTCAEHDEMLQKSADTIEQFAKDINVLTKENAKLKAERDAVPVVHGEQIYNKDTGEIRCNLCNALVAVTMYEGDIEQIIEVENFCFNCGAKMDGGI